jgi:hypothetical protein
VAQHMCVNGAPGFMTNSLRCTYTHVWNAPGLATLTRAADQEVQELVKCKPGQWIIPLED